MNGFSDRRGSARARTRLPARIVFGGRTFTLDCTICDLSETGACVATPGTDILPKHVVLIEPERFMAFDSTTRWRHSKLVGLRFDSISFLDGKLDSGQQALRMYARQARREWGYKAMNETSGPA